MSYYDLSEHITLPSRGIKPAIVRSEAALPGPPAGGTAPAVIAVRRGPISSGGVMGTPDQPAQKAPTQTVAPSPGRAPQPVAPRPPFNVYAGGANSPAVRNRTPAPSPRVL